MFLLERAHLVQFFLFQAQTLELDRTTAIIAPNGAGKSALLDALQIVMLGGDRNQIRFNAQAGGSHRARTIRDYCLGVYRGGEDGRVRDTATTYLSLVFRDTETDEVLTAGIALGASINEPDHRMHGLYLLPGVALELEEHLEHVEGRELPLEWATFREQAVRRCRQADTRAELHATSDRFVRDLLVRLRPAPTAYLDPVAYRKAFQNALNLQRVTDVDLFVRTLVAEERPTEIARFRALLEGFRQIKARIEQVARRIEEAEIVEARYRKLAGQATRAASYRALAAEYRRDAHQEQMEAVEQSLGDARDAAASCQRSLTQARSDLQAASDESTHLQQRLQGMRGYGEQASLDQLAATWRDELKRLKQDLLRSARFAREHLTSAGALGLQGIDPAAAREFAHPWQALSEMLEVLPSDAEVELDPQELHGQLRDALARAVPLIQAVNRHAREAQNALDAARQRADAARQNLARLTAGQSELRADVIRLMNYLREEGIHFQPICDLVRVTDPQWQPAIEAYLRSHVEALLVPAEDEERAVRLYRALKGNRAVYGVKLALASQARRDRGKEPVADQVGALLDGDNRDAVAYLRRQLGDLRQVETETQLVRGDRALSRDGLVAKGGGIERLRLPAAAELRIGASGNRERGRLLQVQCEQADADVRALEAEGKVLANCAAGLSRLNDSEAVAGDAYDTLLRHREVSGRYRAQLRLQAEQSDPDLLRLTEETATLRERAATLQAKVETLIRDETKAQSQAESLERALNGLQAQSQTIANAAVSAFSDQDVDPNLVERYRNELEERFPEFGPRLDHCDERVTGAERALAAQLPEAWSGLAQYARDQGLSLELEPEQWRPAHAMLAREIIQLKETELVQHQAAADEAYTTAVETFRSNVASALYDNFTRLKHQINTLNRTLQSSPPFSNNERYQFRYEVAPELKDLHAFIKRATDVGESDTLFGSAGELPAAFRDIVEDRASGKAGQPSPLDDYRRFFNFEVVIRQGDKLIGTLSERMRSGSGGEHRAPLYVIAGAALAAAYGKGEGLQGGLGVIMLDEFGDKIDSQNARATTDYLRSLGLQLVLAAPDTAQGTLTGVLDSYVELFRDGPLLQMERHVVTEAGRDLLTSDQFELHPHLLEAEIARINAERKNQEAMDGQHTQPSHSPA